MALVASSIPVGVEVIRADAVTSGSRRYQKGELQGTSPLAAMKAFNDAHTDYQATAANGIFNIRPSNHRTDYLDAAAPVARYTAHGIFNARLCSADST